MPGPYDHGYALLIAVDENAVSDWALPDVVKDVEALQAVLVHPDRCGYPPEKVRVITGASATKQGILDGLQWLEDQVSADVSGDTTAIIYYTGHGWQNTNVVPPTYAFIPRDAQRGKLRSTSLRAEDFAEAVAAIQPRRLLVLLDCCHAGGMGVKGIDLPGDSFAAAAPPPTLFTEGAGQAKALDEKGLEQLQMGQGRAVLVSSQGEQKSYVRPDRTMSIFTYHLIEALTGHAQPAGGASDVLVSDVLSYVYRTVPTSAAALGKQQQPDGRLDGNFPVALLLGGKGLEKGMSAPNPLAPLPPPSSGSPSLTFHNEGMQATKVNQAQTIEEGSAHAEGGGDATVYNVSGSGAVATGGGVAAGQGGVAVKGDVHGGINLGGISSRADLGGVGGNIKNSIIAGGHVENVQSTAGHGGGTSNEHPRTVDPAMLNQRIVPLYQAVAASSTPVSQQADVYRLLAELTQLLTGSSQADDSRIAELVDQLVDAVPSAAGAVVALFALPEVTDAAGPVTRYALRRLSTR